MPPAPTPASCESLRRTRRALIAVCALMALWFLLLTFLLIATTWHHTEIVRGKWSFARLLLNNSLLPVCLGYGVAHYHVGRKLLALARETHDLTADAPLRPTGEAFSTFWKANLRAHLLLFAFVVFAWALLHFLR
jgi:hypothetical protein